MSRYILIRPDEDGNPVRFLSSDDVNALLDDPRGNWGVSEFRDIPKGDDDYTDREPQYWPEGTGLLLRVEVANPRPKETVTKWELP